MIARLWHGRTRAADADEYKRYLFNSGIPATVAQREIEARGFYAESRTTSLIL
jgi:hypothetical protein